MCIDLQCHVYKIILDVRVMRTNIVIDDQLMDEALKATGLSTKKEAVGMGLKTLIRLNKTGENPKV